MQSGVDVRTQESIERLVRGAQQGDSDSFAGLYEAFYDKIYRYVMVKTSNVVDAEDITEEVFLRMLGSISSFGWKGYPFTSWLFRIAHNLVIDHYRKRGRQKIVPLGDVDHTAGRSNYAMDEALDMKLSLRQVHRAMEDLSSLQREVITLRFAGGLSLRETAQMMGKKENAIKALQHAGIKKLRMLLVNQPFVAQNPTNQALRLFG